MFWGKYLDAMAVRGGGCVRVVAYVAIAKGRVYEVGLRAWDLLSDADLLLGGCRYRCHLVS